MINRKNKRSQITIFVILALIIVVSIALVFVLIRKPDLVIEITEDPQGYIEDCVEKTLIKANENILENNGYYSENTTSFILYKNEKVPYLCQSSQFYITCMPQEPMFIEHIREEIKNEILNDVEICFDNLEKEFAKKSYEINSEKLDLNIEFKEKSVIANINKKIIIEKQEDSKIYEKFKAEIQTPVYRLARLAQKIVNYESTLCEFNLVNWIRYYPDIKIERYRTGDQTKIYTLMERESEEDLKFAVRTCLLPAGI